MPKYLLSAFRRTLGKKSCLPSAAETIFGKIMALGIPNSLPSAEKRPLGKLGKTLGKTETHGKKLPCGHPSVSVPAVRSLPSVFL